MLTKNKTEEFVETKPTLELLNKELKRIASMKSRLKKQVGRKDYLSVLSDLEASEMILKQAKSNYTGVAKRFTQLTQEDIDKLTYDEATRALKSIQSKKSNSRWLTTVEGDNDEYRQACIIEAMLKKRRSEVQPTETNKILDIIALVKESESVDKDIILQLLEDLV